MLVAWMGMLCHTLRFMMCCPVPLGATTVPLRSANESQVPEVWVGLAAGNWVSVLS